VNVDEGSLFDQLEFPAATSEFERIHAARNEARQAIYGQEHK